MRCGRCGLGRLAVKGRSDGHVSRRGGPWRPSDWVVPGGSLSWLADNLDHGFRDNHMGEGALEALLQESGGTDEKPAEENLERRRGCDCCRVCLDGGLDRSGHHSGREIVGHERQREV